MHLPLTEHLFVNGHAVQEARDPGHEALVAFAQFLHAVRDVSIQSFKPAGIPSDPAKRKTGFIILSRNKPVGTSRARTSAHGRIRATERLEPSEPNALASAGRPKEKESMPTSKNPASYRLSEEALSLIEQLAKAM